MSDTTDAIPTAAEARCLRFAAGQAVNRRRLNDAAHDAHRLQTRAAACYTRDMAEPFSPHQPAR